MSDEQTEQGGKEASGENWYELAEQGWRELVAASDKIQRAANKLKKSERSIDGYNIERALLKHKPDMMKDHLAGLQEHRKDQNV